MNYFEFSDTMNHRNMKPEELTLAELLEIVQHQDAHIEKLISIANQQQERITDLTDTLYSIFPAIEVIETLAEDPAEKADMLSHYVIINPDWDYDRNHYQPDKIIDEMAAGTKDEQAKDCLQTLYQDYGAGCLVRLYKKWKGIDHDRNLIHNLMMDTEQDTQKG